VHEDRELSESTADPGEWVLGIDVGDRSVGLGAVKVENGLPSEILAGVSVIHDGGVGDPEKKTSRLAQAGMARRIRRRRRRRQARLRKVDRLVEDQGWVLPPSAGLHPYDAWEARRRLVEEEVLDEQERAVLLGRAVTHMARHRGWRNPWLPVRALWEAEVPSKGLLEAVQEAEERFGVTLAPGTLGQLGALLLRRPGLRVHPREATEHGASLLSSRARQEDVLWELRLIAEKQGVTDEVLGELADAIFRQHPARVPQERIGRDPLEPAQLRAPVASLEFQEFRVRDKVANLRIREGRGTHPLTLEERQRVVEALLGSNERLTWAEVALDLLELSDERSLVIPDEQGYSSRAPRDDTVAAIEALLAAKEKTLEQTRRWWAGASRAERAALVRLLTDPADGDELDVALQIPEGKLEELAGISLPSGRAAYGRGTLQRLNDAMARSGLDRHEAIKACFGVGDDWRPPLPGLDEPTGHPTVDRNLAAVRKFLSAATLRWGPPSLIVVELAREGERTPAQLQAEERERARRRRWNDQLREELRQSGIVEPRRADLVKRTLLSVYRNTCLYCGRPISWEDSELDHIVPRADGGVNRLENLAVVCLPCNRAKNRQPFGQWAKQQDIDLAAVLERVRALRYEPGSRWSSVGELRAYQRAVEARLRRVTTDPEEVRSIGSTSYAAVALTERLRRFMTDHGNDADQTVAVFSGGITAEARQVLDLSIPELLGRPGRSKRLDRRHHAIDALLLTTLTPGVARMLRARSVARREQEFFRRPAEVDLESWKARAASSETFNAWRKAGERLVHLLGEARKDDRLAVVRPLRLRPSGQFHEETVAALDQHRVGDPWTQEQIRRVVDVQAYVALSDAAERFGGILGSDDHRFLPSGHGEIGPDALVELFPEDRAMMRVGTGAVNLGTVHHARLYAWKAQRKGYEFAVLRVWLGDLAVCGLLGAGVDVLTSELPPWSQSWRHAHDSLRKAASEGRARYLGWLAPGDEIEFADPRAIPGRGRIQSFLSHFPERHWFVKSFEQPTVVTLGALYLAEEGLAEGEDFPDDVRTVIRRGWRPSINTLFRCPDLRVIRRTAVGKPRWRSAAGNLPISWSPWQRAAEVLE
jgi:CRISPR-associated endonuclease Csn1